MTASQARGVDGERLRVGAVLPVTLEGKCTGDETDQIHINPRGLEQSLHADVHAT